MNISDFIIIYHVDLSELKKQNVNFLINFTQCIYFFRAKCNSGCKSEAADVLYILLLYCMYLLLETLVVR